MTAPASIGDRRRNEITKFDAEAAQMVEDAYRQFMNRSAADE